MKRGAPLKRVPFLRRRKVEGPDIVKEPHPLAKATRRATFSGGTSGKAVEKTEPKRNRRLLDLAKNKPCLLRVGTAGVHLHDPATVVACHSNWSEHGKAAARKADDHRTVWGCAACHRWLDQGGAPAEEKRAVFDKAYRLQAWFWEQIAGSATTRLADRLAAKWALDQLKEGA